MQNRGESPFVKQMKSQLRTVQQQRQQLQSPAVVEDLVEQLAEMTWNRDLARVRTLVRGSLEDAEKKIQVGMPQGRNSATNKKAGLPDLVPDWSPSRTKSLPIGADGSRDLLLRTVMNKLQENAASRIRNAVHSERLTAQPGNSQNVGLFEYRHGSSSVCSTSPIENKLRRLERKDLPSITVGTEESRGKPRHAEERRVQREEFPTQLNDIGSVARERPAQQEELPMQMNDIASIVGELLHEEINQWMEDFDVPLIRYPKQADVEVGRPDKFSKTFTVEPKELRDAETSVRPHVTETSAQTDNLETSKKNAVVWAIPDLTASGTQTAAKTTSTKATEASLRNPPVEERGVNTHRLECRAAGTQHSAFWDDEAPSEPRVLTKLPEPPIDLFFLRSGRSLSPSVSPEPQEAANGQVELSVKEASSTSISSGLTSDHRELSPGQIDFPESLADTTFSISEGEVLFRSQLQRLPVEGASDGEVSEGQYISQMNQTFTLETSNTRAETHSVGEIRVPDTSTAEDFSQELYSEIIN